MSFDWKRYSLEEISNDISYGYTASAQEEKVGPKFLRITDIRDDFVDWDAVPYCEINEQNKTKYKLEIGDLCIARTGATTGINTVIKKEVDAVFASYLIRFRLNKDIANPFFVGYVLSSKQWSDFVASIIGGSAQPGANAKQLSKFEMLIPPLTEQEAITRLLSSFDDKIVLNNATIKNLEEMAQALFNRWFVDFEFPDENGEPYKSSGGELEESGLGLIPKGWKVSSLDGIAEYLNGLAMQKFRPKGEDFIPVIKIRELNRGRTGSDSDKASPAIDRKYIVNNGDVLFSWSGTLEIKLWCGGVGGLNQHLFKVTSNVYDKWFYYYWTKHHIEKFRRIASDKVTTMGHIKRSDLKEAKVLIPDNRIYQFATAMFQPIVDQIVELSMESHRLERVRDSLLPRLISGEIRVPIL